MGAAVFVMMRGYVRAGHKMTSDVIALAGWPNRLLVVVYCVWVLTVARQLLKAGRR